MRKLLCFGVLCACLMLQISLLAQIYTFDNGGGDGLWTNAANWNPMPPPNPLTIGSIIIAANCTQDIDRTIQSGASLTINAGATLTRTSNTLSMRGTMTINGTLINNMTLSITATGTLINNGTIDNGNSVADNINNVGVIQNNGVINILAGRLDNQSTGIFHNNATGSINISGGATLRNQNQMYNNGAITNYGTLNAANGDMDLFMNDNTGTITNYGTLSIPFNLDNNGTILNYNTITITNDTGVLNNNATGTLTNTLGGTINNRNILNNAGTLTNDGTLNAAAGPGDTFNNTGTLINNLNLDIGNGNLINAASGEITNNSGGTLTINNNGTLTNNGLTNNNGLVTNNNNIMNTGTFNNNAGAVLQNGNGAGDSFVNTGVLNNKVGATINNFDGAIINTTEGTFINNGSYNGAEPLPIELLSFIGKAQETAVLLKWETASEKENAYMAVERSKDGIHFQEIGRRKGAGTTSLRQFYDFTDTTPFFGVNYYRLRQVDSDEKATYHTIITVEFGGKIAEGIRLFPTQTQQDITIALNVPPLPGSTLQIFDASGKLVKQQIWNAENTQETIPVAVLPVGTYFVTLRNGNELQTLRFMKL